MDAGTLVVGIIRGDESGLVGAVKVAGAEANLDAVVSPAGAAEIVPSVAFVEMGSLW